MRNFRVGHVHFMLFVFISFVLVNQREPTLQWNMGFKIQARKKGGPISCLVTEVSSMGVGGRHVWSHLVTEKKGEKTQQKKHNRSHRRADGSWSLACPPIFKYVVRWKEC